MSDDFTDRRWMLACAVPASLVLHSLIGAYLIFGLPESLQQPQKEEAIAVELVPLPEPPDKARAEPAEPNSVKPKQPKNEKPPSSSREAASPSPAFLRPVFHFGEKDAGPRASLKGNSSQAKPRDVDASIASGSGDKRETDGRYEEAPKDSVEGLAATKPPPKPDVKGGPPTLSAVQAPVQVPAHSAPETPAPKAVSGAESASVLEEAKTLFSPNATGSSIATTAMGKLPRGERISQLCASQLSEQLRHAWPPFFPEFVPNIHLKDGTVLDVPDAAFRANQQWRQVSYRCEVDKEAKKVVSFAFRVGNPIPKEEWKRRGLPGG